MTPRNLIAGCLLALGILLSHQPTAWAKPIYPREQVEEHLRSMFPGFKQNLLDPTASKTIQLEYLPQKKKFRVFFVDIKSNEEPEMLGIAQKLFSDILNVQVIGTHPDNNDFDLLLYLSDDLPLDGLKKGYRAYLQYNGESEEDYKTRLEKTNEYRLYIHRIKHERKDGEVFIVAATQRDKESPMMPFTTQMRFTLFHVLTGARTSNVIIPSVMNRPDNPPHDIKFAPIDIAILRAIHSHNDWSSLDYEPQIKLLTDRVMNQLSSNP